MSEHFTTAQDEVLNFLKLSRRDDGVTRGDIEGGEMLESDREKSHRSDRDHRVYEEITYSSHAAVSRRSGSIDERHCHAS